MNKEKFSPRYVGASWNYVIKYLFYNDLFNLAIANKFLGNYIGNTPALWRFLSLHHAADICVNFSAMSTEMLAGDVDLTAAIKITGSPQQNLNSTYYRVPGCEIPRHTVTDIDGNELDMPAILACYASYDGPSLYQTEHGNWAVHGSRDAWEVPSVTYMTWDERRNDYGHRRGSSFMWYCADSVNDQTFINVPIKMQKIAAQTGGILTAGPVDAVTITVKGAPERKLNTTYDRVPYEHKKKGEKVLRPVACYRSGHGCSLYQLSRGNWGLSHSKKSWLHLKCHYATWERGRGHYGHKPGSKLTWYCTGDIKQSLTVAESALQLPIQLSIPLPPTPLEFTQRFLDRIAKNSKICSSYSYSHAYKIAFVIGMVLLPLKWAPNQSVSFKLLEFTRDRSRKRSASRRRAVTAGNSSAKRGHTSLGSNASAAITAGNSSAKRGRTSLESNASAEQVFRKVVMPILRRVMYHAHDGNVFCFGDAAVCDNGATGDADFSRGVFTQLRLAFKWIRNVMDSDPIATYEMQIRCIATYQQQLEDLLQFSSWPKTSSKKSAKVGASKKNAFSKEKVQKKSKSQSKSAVPMIRQGPLNIRQFGRRMGSLSIVGTGSRGKDQISLKIASNARRPYIRARQMKPFQQVKLDPIYKGKRCASPLPAATTRTNCSDGNARANDARDDSDTANASTKTDSVTNDADNKSTNTTDNNTNGDDGDSASSSDEDESSSFPRWVRPGDYRLRTATRRGHGKSVLLGYDKEKKEFGLKGVKERPVETEEDLERALADASACMQALARRKRKAFKLQDAHTIIQINIKHKRKTRTGNVCLKESVFTIVHASGADGFLLKQVCKFRGSNKAQVPYRNSALTKLLQPCLRGSRKCVSLVEEHGGRREVNEPVVRRDKKRPYRVVQDKKFHEVNPNSSENVTRSVQHINFQHFDKYDLNIDSAPGYRPSLDPR